MIKTFGTNQLVGITWHIRSGYYTRTEVALSDSRGQDEFIEAKIREFKEAYRQEFDQKDLSYDAKTQLKKVYYLSKDGKVEIIILFQRKNLRGVFEEIENFGSVKVKKENEMAYATVGIAYSISRANPDRIDRVEVVLTGSREDFLDEMIKEFEERYNKKFYKEKESYNKNNQLVKAIYYAAANQISPTEVDLIISFEKKSLEDLREENYLKPKKDQVRTITYPDHLHARVQIKSEVLGTRDRMIGIMEKEGYPHEDVKDDFLIYILAKTGDEYDSYFE